MYSVAIRAVLFDVGGPLDTEVLSEGIIDRHILEALGHAGVAVTPGEVTAASHRAVARFAANAYSAMCWDLAGGDLERATLAFAEVAARSEERRTESGGFELREGASEMLEWLIGNGLLLGLAANQPVSIIAELDRLGLGQFFSHREVSGHHRYRKPDVRLLLRACEHLGVAPQECIMVGDRIDNDIVPARLLGMGAVLLRTGRHRAQEARSWEELPHLEAFDTAGMGKAIMALVARL